MCIRVSPYSLDSLTTIGKLKNWGYISGGYSHTIAIKTDGSLWAWGGNDYGQLGTGTSSAEYFPRMISPSSDWAWVDAGLFFNLALKDDGSLWAWGSNMNGQIGNGTT